MEKDPIGMSGLTTAQLIAGQEQEILEDWMAAQLASVTQRADLISAADQKRESAEFLRNFVQAISTDNWEDITAPPFKPLLQLLGEISRSRAILGFTPSETASYVFSLKDSLLVFLQEQLGDQPEVLNREIVRVSQLLDRLGLYTFETYSQSREALITEQGVAIIELASPTLRVWDEIVLLPLVGVVDTERAQLMLDSLLNAIAETEALVAILDVTGVPIIDTRVAQHILTAVEGAHMLGAETIITGVSVEAAKTLTKLQVRLGDVITRGSLRAGLRYALKLVGIKLTREEE